MIGLIRGGYFWLAVLLVTAIQHYGDAYGHFGQWIENDNTELGNIGPALWLDLIVPTVGLVLYRLYTRADAIQAPGPSLPPPGYPHRSRGTAPDYLVPAPR